MVLQNILLDSRSSIILEAMNAAVWEWNIMTNELIVNERWAEIVGYTKSELEPTTFDTWKNRVHPNDYRVAMNELEKLFRKEKSFYSVETRMKHKDGRWIWVLDSGKVIKWAVDGTPLIALGTQIDITEKKIVQLELEKSERNLRQIIENTKDIIYRIDMEKNFTYLSSGWTNLLGYSVEEGIGTSLKDIVHPNDLNKIETFFKKIDTSEVCQELRGYRLKTSSGKWRYFETSGTVIIEDEKRVGYSGIAKDINELIEKQRKMEFLSYHDNLTKFKNRHYLEKIEKEINQPENYPLCIISIDLNHLKYVNDNFGHYMGDKLIKTAARIIKNNMPNKDYLFRLGGDEFLILLPNTDDEKAYSIRENIKEEIRNKQNKGLPLSMAYGYHTKTTYSGEFCKEMRKADKFMYENKKKYKESIVDNR
ncbi:MAG: PAS domain S-box protein [Candidatus Izemoplasmatales bacterium]